MSSNTSVILVTGATSGIGLATVHELVHRGHRVAAVGRNLEALERLTNSLEGVHPFRFDLNELEAVPDLVSAVRDVGSISGLVCAAGVIQSGAIETVQLHDFQQMFRVNVDAPYALLRACGADLKQHGGAVVNVSSVTGVRPFSDLSAYCASKAALDHLTRCMAIEWAPDRVRVNAVNPGVVITNLHRRGGMDEEAYGAFLRRTVHAHPLGRVGTAEEVAELIAFLLLEAGWITGECIAVDGGRHLTAAR